MKSTSKILVLLLLLAGFNSFAKPQDDFWKATKQCDLEGVKKAISKGADPKALNELGQNSLTLAVFCPEVMHRKF